MGCSHIVQKMNNVFNIEKNRSLLELNTFGIDALADEYVELHYEDEYKTLVMSRALANKPFFILGGGSNVVFSGEYHGIIVHPANKGVRIEKKDAENGVVFVEAGAGEMWADFVDCCIANGWHGIENLAAIPGTVGAAPVQNVGAYGCEAKDVVERVHYYDIKTGEEHWIDNADCRFAYRNSIFKGELKNRCLIDRVVFRLSLTFTPNLQYRALASALAERGIYNPSARQLADIVAEVRHSKLPDPKLIGSAGSFFKNPEVTASVYEELVAKYPDIVAFPTDDDHYKLSAGWMIEHCGWKGQSIGHVGVYEKQALVLVNLGGCIGCEVRALANAIIADVEAKYGVTLTPEAIFV